MATGTRNEFLQWCSNKITLPSVLAEATITEPSEFHTVQKDIQARRQLVGRKGIGGKRREEKGKWKILRYMYDILKKQEKVAVVNSSSSLVK